MEGRTLGKFTLKEETSMKSIEFREPTVTKLERIAWLSARNPNKVYHQLMHHFNAENLLQCFHELDGKKAVGEDGMKKSQYEEQLNSNIKDFIERMKRMGYRPGPVRQVLIPKEGKPEATRPLGISNFEDKIFQKMMQKVLESIYEPLFLNCSYGFRPGRGCHDAIKALRDHLYRNEVEVVIDIDLANFFGTIDHKLLEQILREKIADKKFLRYIIRMFKSGVLTEGELNVSDEGVQQGSVCSPILANVFAHYVIDEWFNDTVKNHCRGATEMFRYADDMVICCRHRQDAKRIREALAKRLARFKLKLNENKTQEVSFSKREFNKGVKQGTFDFLGFTFYLGKTKTGKSIVPKLRTAGKRFRAKLKRVNDWCRMIRNRYPLAYIWNVFRSKLRGHCQYYGVSFNTEQVYKFIHEATRIMFKWLNRRSQRRSFYWRQFKLFMNRHPLPKAVIYHRLF